MKGYDLIIIGAGLVGASLIAALKNSPFRIAVLETHLPEQISIDDPRPLSLTFSSQKILATLGIWSHLQELAAPILAVHVSEQNHLGVLHFRAKEENVAALGYVVPFGRLQRQIYQQAAQNPHVKFIPIQKLIKIQNNPNQIKVTAATIHGEETFTAELLVAADGAHSPARELLNIPVQQWSSDEVALTLGVELNRPHQSIAYERFTERGVIAVLPLKNPHRCQIVWTISRQLSEEVSLWSDSQLGNYLSEAMHGRLGECRIEERGRAFPLETVLAEEQIRPGVVLLGNAAHTLYPLAAQGFNLGLRDVAALAETLMDSHENAHSLNDERVLRKYLNWRQTDQRRISNLTAAVTQLFGLHLPGLGLMRGAGLLAADIFPPLKRRLAKRFLGLSGKQPKLARGIVL